MVTLTPGARGAVSEMLVACDLERRGLSTYRAVSMHAPFDLAVYDARGLIRVEVKTATSTTSTGKLHSPVAQRPDRYDVLALVGHDGVIQYTTPAGAPWSWAAPDPTGTACVPSWTPPQYQHA